MSEQRGQAHTHTHTHTHTPQEERDGKETELTTLQGKTPADLWDEDIEAVLVVISSGVVFKLNTIWPTKITTHRFYYYFYEPIV